MEANSNIAVDLAFIAKVRKRAAENVQKIGYISLWSMGKEDRALYMADAAVELVNEAVGMKVL